MYEASAIFRFAIQQVRHDLKLDKGRLFSSPTFEGFLFTTLKVVLWFVPKFILLLLLGCAVLVNLFGIMFELTSALNVTLSVSPFPKINEPSVTSVPVSPAVVG